jgi:hypothetical protein
MGLLLRTERHIATHEQNQIFVEIVNRHMPATPRLPPATPLSQVNLNDRTNLAAIGIGLPRCRKNGRNFAPRPPRPDAPVQIPVVAVGCCLYSGWEA